MEYFVPPLARWASTYMAIGTAALLWKFKKLPEPVVVLVAALLGLVLYPMPLTA